MDYNIEAGAGTEVNADSFAYPPDNGGRGPYWKGYIEMDVTQQHEKPSVIWTATKKKLNARQQEYFEKTLSLAKEHGIPVLLVGFPNPDYENDHEYYNALWAVAEKHGVDGINYNDPDLRLRLTYSSCFADWQHLNVKGSVIFTRRLGSDLKELYDLPDRRGDQVYETWQRCADDWYEKYPDYKPVAEGI
jgi:hypothetical protein